MAKLIYSAIASLDGYIEDESGRFDWAAPDEEVHAFVNDLERPIGTYLYGRRMYETMVYWETAHTVADQPPLILDYAEIWQAADKVVYSRTLEAVSSDRTRIERDFDPEAIRRLKAAAERDLSVGGPELAAQALKAGLVDEIQLFVAPVVVGGATRRCPTASASGWSCSMSAASAAASSTSGTGRRARVSTFALIHGGGGSAWDWHLVVPELRERGHDAVAVDLPTEDPAAGWWDYADAVVEAIGERDKVVVVGHSLVPSLRRSFARGGASTSLSSLRR